jgi:hypothetical protein
MPLTEKGEKIMAAMKKQYGGKKGEEVFYASKNAGKITGVDTAERDDDNQHMGFTSGQSEKIQKLTDGIGSLVTRMDAFFSKRFAMRKPKKVKPRTKDNMQPSMPHPKSPGGG